MTNPVLPEIPGQETRTLGSGVLSIRKVGETAYEEIAALKSFSYTIASERKEATSMRSGMKVVVASANIAFKTTFKFEVESSTVDNMAKFLSSPDSIVETSLQTAGSYANQIFTVTTPGRWQDLGKKKLTITNIKKVTHTVPATGTAGGSNTGDGTCASVTAGTVPKVGTYTVTCITKVTNGGVFSVTDPDGNDLGDATVGTPFTSTQINLSLADGTTDFEVNDVFTIAVTGAAGDTLVNLTDYYIETEQGFIAPAHTSQSATSKLAVAGTQFYVNATYPTLKEYSIKAGETANMTYEFLFFSKANVGYMEQVLGYGNFSPSGDLTCVGEDFRGFGFEGTCQSHATYGNSGLKYSQFKEV